MKSKYTKLYIFLAAFAVLSVFGIYKLQDGKPSEIIANDLTAEEEIEEAIPVSKEMFDINISSFNVTENKVKSGESLGLILGREGIGNQTVHNLIQLSDTVFRVRNINVNNTYYLFHNWCVTSA